MVDIEFLKSTFGIPLIIVQQKDVYQLGIGEVIREDDNSITIRNPGIVVNKPHYHQILERNNNLQPPITIPSDYTDCMYNIVGIQSQDIQVQKDESVQIIELKDIALINLYRKLVGI